VISGISQNGLLDPLTGAPEFRAVLWKDGNLADLGTFGGNNSCAGAVNDRGQVVGGAATSMDDPFSLCFGPQQTRAFLWENGSKQDLGGPDAIAEYINDRGQVNIHSFGRKAK
jgi:probable HAF family extracellular repeat protein